MKGFASRVPPDGEGETMADAMVKRVDALLWQTAPFRVQVDLAGGRRGSSRRSIGSWPR